MDETTGLKAWALALYREHGRLTPELVKEAARPTDSPAHQYVFHVSADVAAEEYFTERAHRLIRHVKVSVVRGTEAAPRRVRFFHAVPGDEDAYEYLSIDDLLRYPDKLESAKTEAMRRLHDAEHAIEDLDAIAADTPTAPSAKRALSSVRAAREELLSPPTTV